MKLLCFILSALLQYMVCSANPKDKDCANNFTFPTLQAQHTHVGNLLAAVDLKHVYNIHSDREETTRKESRIMLKKDQGKWVYFWTSFNSYANPRTLYIRFNGERVLASMASHEVTYLRDIVETKRTWSCINWSLKKGQSSSNVFSSYHSNSVQSGSELYTDRIEIKVLSDNVPLGPSKDLECFNKQFPTLQNASSKHKLRINITKMFYKQVGASRWCCQDKKEKSTILDLAEGQKKVVSLKYVSITHSIAASKEMKSLFKDENPRNLTLMLSNGVLYAGMAYLKETAMYDGYDHRWMYTSSWICVNVTIPIESRRRNKLTRRLDLSMYYVYARSVQKRIDYVLLETSNATGVVSSFTAAVLVASAFATLLGTSLI